MSRAAWIVLQALAAAGGVWLGILVFNAVTG